MTTQLIPLLAILNTLGALIGTGMTTFAEVFYTHAVSDGEIDHHERKYLRRLFRGFAFGITLVILSNIALIVFEYLVPYAPESVLTVPFWSLQILTLIIIFVGWLLSKRQIQWWLGSSAVLVAWWLILLIDLGLLNAAGFFEIIFTYIIATILAAGALSYLRMHMRELEPLLITHNDD
ncbi:MAG: hypothetical protein P4M11_01655 [Candidatus Pacebacteria bacterium]|nr:hypothetical protein [Candidatus Paceibacterota bacterium]